MGYCRIDNIETGEVELEVGVRPLNQEDDDYINKSTGTAFNSMKPNDYIERMKDE